MATVFHDHPVFRRQPCVVTFIFDNALATRANVSHVPPVKDDSSPRLKSPVGTLLGPAYVVRPPDDRPPRGRDVRRTPLGARRSPLHARFPVERETLISMRRWFNDTNCLQESPIARMIVSIVPQITGQAAVHAPERSPRDLCVQRSHDLPVSCNCLTFSSRQATFRQFGLGRSLTRIVSRRNYNASAYNPSIRESVCGSQPFNISSTEPIILLRRPLASSDVSFGTRTSRRTLMSPPIQSKCVPLELHAGRSKVTSKCPSIACPLLRNILSDPLSWSAAPT